MSFLGKLGEVIAAASGHPLSNDAYDTSYLNTVKTAGVSAQTQEAIAKAKRAQLGLTMDERTNSGQIDFQNISKNPEWLSNPDAAIASIMMGGYGDQFEKSMSARNSGQVYDLRATAADPNTEWGTMQRALAAIAGKPVDPLASLGDEVYSIFESENPTRTTTEYGRARIAAENALAAERNAQSRAHDRSNPANQFETLTPGDATALGLPAGTVAQRDRRTGKLDIVNKPATTGTVAPQQRVTDANDALALIKNAETLINSATGSYLGTGWDQGARAVGIATSGAINAQKLKALEGALIAKMPKMSGPQSDKDVALYKQMAGQIGDSTVPAEQKLAALETVKEIQNYYAGNSGASGTWGDQPTNSGIKFLGFE